MWLQHNRVGLVYLAMGFECDHVVVVLGSNLVDDLLKQHDMAGLYDRDGHPRRSKSRVFSAALMHLLSFCLLSPHHLSKVGKVPSRFRM